MAAAAAAAAGAAVAYQPCEHAAQPTSGKRASCLTLTLTRHLSSSRRAAVASGAVTTQHPIPRRRGLLVSSPFSGCTGFSRKDVPLASEHDSLPSPSRRSSFAGGALAVEPCCRGCFSSCSSRSTEFTTMAASTDSDGTFMTSPFDGDLGGDDKFREECGVFGIIGDPNASHLTYLGLRQLQHRGEEAAGIVAGGGVAGDRLRRVAGLGFVTDVFPSAASLEELPGSAAVGHVRYSTAGAVSSPLNAQPFLAGYRFGQLAVAHNGNLVNYASLRRKLESKGSIFNCTSDTEVILHLIATSTARPLLSRIVDACEALAGAYSLVLMTSGKLFAVRDPHGFRPLVLGRRPNGAVVVASETCALDLVDAEYVREIGPGEVLVVDGADMSMSSACLLPKKPLKACIFEHIYFALPNSIVFGHDVHESRIAFGRLLAEESPAPTADVVIPVPDSGFYAALGFANASGLPFQQGLLRSHYVGRSFIQPSQEIRDLAVKLKLSPVRGVLEGKSVVVVDDSLVRGTTSGKIVRLLRSAGAREVHMRIASPPIVGPCMYGIDTPSEEELISNRLDHEGVRRAIGSDSLAFLSLDKLRLLHGESAGDFCDACFSRNYPMSPPPPEPEPELED